MDLKFWSRKKRKRVELELAEATALAKLEAFRERLLKSDEATRAVDAMKCPPVMDATHLCVCKSCPKRSECAIERICRTGGCTAFITGCSLKKSIIGDLDGEKEEGSDGDYNGPFTGVSGLLTKELCGESSGGGLRETGMVSANGESSLRLDHIGED